MAKLLLNKTQLCIPQQDCKFITCTESLNSVEQKWFWVSTLKNRVMLVLNKYLSHGTHSATWTGLMLSTIDLERRVLSCRVMGYLTQTAVLEESVFLSCISADVLLLSIGHGNKWKQKRNDGFAMLSSHLSLLVFTQRGACQCQKLHFSHTCPAAGSGSTVCHVELPKS